MRGAEHAKLLGHAAAVAGEGGGGNSTSSLSCCKDCDRKVRFKDRERNCESGHGGGGCTATTKQLKDKPAEKPRSSRAADGVTKKDKQRGESFSSREKLAQQQAANQAQEIRLRGKLKWLFEQDRMFWESNSRSNSRSNSAKSSRRGSPEVDRSRSLNGALNGAPKPTMDFPGDAKVVHVVEESFRRVCSSTRPPVNKLKPPRQEQTDDKAMVSNGASLSSGRRENSPAKVPWIFSNSTAKFWPRGKSKAPQNSSNPPSTQSKSRAPAVRQACVDLTKRVKASDCATLMSREEILSDYDDAPKSGGSSEMCTSSDEDEEEMRKKVDVVLARGGDGSLQDVKNQAAYLKVKCDMLSKEKDHAMRKWKKSCQEIDGAAKMAQALRTAIETLLEASAGDSRADFKARQDVLEDQTEALKLRMEVLRRKNSEGLRRQSKVKAPSVPSEEERVELEPLKKSSDGRSLASPEIPTDTEHKVEALRTRLEKLMLATNSRVSDDQRQPAKRAEEQKKPVEEWLQKAQSDEKAELKMKGWLNSLSAELTSEASPDTSRGTFTKCSVTSTPFISKQVTPSTSKEESPWSSSQDRDRDGPGSAQSVDTKKNVIHKIAEEVRLEAEQWFQVQELLGRVGEDMKSLQEACSTWERRAILAEAQVVEKQQQQEGQEQKEKTSSQLGDEKFAELQKEMLRLRETVDDVKKQVGDINIDPSRWFKAAQKFGYAFMPVNLNMRDTSCDCKGKCNHSNFGRRTPHSSGDQGRERNSAISGGNSQSTSSATTSSIISLSEKTPAEHEARQRSQLPSQEWAKEIAKAEEDEILTTANATGQVPKLEFPNDTIVRETSSASGEEKTHDKSSREKVAKLFHKELELESSGSRGDMLLQMTASIRERCSTILQQEEQLLRYANLSGSRRSRSPLKDVLENITSSKENKRPY